MMTSKKDNELINDFFSRNLTEEQKKEFLEKADSDPGFLKQFVKGVELEGAFEELFGTDETEEENDGKEENNL